MAYNETGKAATNKYRSKFDMIQIRVDQGVRDKIAKHALNQGESMNSFVVRAIQETMERDLNSLNETSEASGTKVSTIPDL